MRAAAALLTGARSVDALAAMLRAVGVVSTVAPLDTTSREALGVGALAHADLGAGAGSIRVLLAELSAGDDFRETLQRIARTLATRAPHVLWLVAAVDSRGANAAVAGWSLRGDTRRVASFVWEPDHVVDSDAETLCAVAAVR